jgi:hypothetical protein
VLIFPLLAFSLQSMRSRLVVLWRVVLCCVVSSHLVVCGSGSGDEEG